MKKVIVATLCVLCSMSSMAEKKKAIFTLTPKMTCTNCENKIRSNMRFEKGILNVEPSVAKQTVVIQYNTEKTTSAKIVSAFKKLGYTATEVTEKETKK